MFDKEIFLECTFESEYGTLKLHSVVVPDFSDSQIEFGRFEKCFDKIKAFMKEDDLLKKNEISKSIPFYFTPALRNYNSSSEAYNFAEESRHILRVDRLKRSIFGLVHIFGIQPFVYSRIES